jgi:hypothetical protein
LRERTEDGHVPFQKYSASLRKDIPVQLHIFLSPSDYHYYMQCGKGFVPKNVGEKETRLKTISRFHVSFI